MVCPCGDTCNCKGHCTCQAACCTCLACHKMDLCNRCHFSLCNATLTGSDNEQKFCQCLPSEIKVPRTQARRSHPTTTRRTTTGNAKPKDCESGKDLISSLVSKSYPLPNESKSLISEHKEKESSAQGEPRKSRFGSLKLKMSRISSRFRKQKHRKNSHGAVIGLDRRNETSDESSVETDLSDDTDYSPSKMTESVRNEMNDASLSLLQPSLKLEKYSFTSTQVYRNLKEAVNEKSLSSSSRGVTDTFFARQFDELDGVTFEGKQSKGNRSFLPSKSPPAPSSHFSLSPLHIKSLKSSEKFMPSHSSNKNHAFKISENRKSSISSLKDSENFPSAHSPNTHRPIFFIGDSIRPKSTSDVDKSYTIPTASQEKLPSSQSYSSYFDTRSFRTSLDEGKISELLNVSDEILSLTQSVTSKAKNSNSIKSPSPNELSISSTSHELNQTYGSCSLSQEPLLSFHSVSSSPHSSPLTTPPWSSLELPLLARDSLDNSNFEDQSVSHAATLFFVSSDLSGDFETLDIRSSPDSTDSESVSSSEFLPCSYCRLFSYAPSIRDSVIPYEPLE